MTGSAFKLTVEPLIKPTFIAILVTCTAGCSGLVGSMEEQTPASDSGAPTGAPDAGQAVDSGTAAVSFDAGATDAGTAPVDAGSSPVDAGNGLVPVFLAQGHLGRTIISCDDGKTWVHDRSDSDGGLCWVTGPNFVECDHQPTSAAGSDSGDGWLFASFGHGYSGTVRASRDGVTWDIINDNSWGSGVSYVDGFLLWAAGQWPGSTDFGKTWANTSSAIPGGYFDTRVIARFGKNIAVSGDPAAGMFSRDGGKSWFLVTLNDGVQWARNVKVAEGNGRLVTLSSRRDSNNDLVAYQAYSLDEGKTWQGKAAYTGPDDGYDWQGLFFADGQFITFAKGNKLTSADGVTWVSTPVSNAGATRGPVARGPTGTFVSIPNNWGGYYEQQHAYRSTDGITWSQLSSQAFPGGHPIGNIVSGTLPASACR